MQGNWGTDHRRILNHPMNVQTTLLSTLLSVLCCALGHAQTSTNLFPMSLDGDTESPSAIPLWNVGQIPYSMNQLKKTRTSTNRGEQQNTYERWIEGVSQPQVTLYRARPADGLQPAVIICPGGGYAGLAIDKEGHDTARWLNSLGITAIVLEYRTSPFKLVHPKADVQEAIRMVRRKANEWHVDRDRLGVLGYSAGGHLASTAGTHFETDLLLRPDFMILVYPVISMDAAITHGGSRDRVLGNDPSEKAIQKYSNELRVTAMTPPTFIVHAADDPSVAIENSQRLAAALKEHGVPFQLEVYDTGGHGFGLGVNGGEVASWPSRCAAWLKKKRLID